MVTHADSIEISNGIGTVEPSGSVQVSPEVPSTTYILTASNLGGMTTKQVTVEVIFPVPTVSLNVIPAIIQPESPVTLSWTSFAAHTVIIEPDIGQVELNGSQVVNPLGRKKAGTVKKSSKNQNSDLINQAKYFRNSSGKCQWVNAGTTRSSNRGTDSKGFML